MVTWFSASLLNTVAQPQVSVAPYYSGRLAALSLTFDDGLFDQYTLAFPQLKARELKATFAIIGSKVGGVVRSKQDRTDGTNGTPCMTWDMLREMAADGQEITSHGWAHQAVTRLSGEALRREVEANDSAIEAHIGKRPVTYFYPGNSKSDEAVAFCEQGRVGSRTFQTSLGSKRTMAFLRNYVDRLIAEGNWGVTMTHGIAQGYDHFQDPQVLWDFMDYICSKQDQLWIATFHDVAAYRQEAANTALWVRYSKREMIVTPVCSLSPVLFNHPLTLVINGPVMSARQNGRDLPVDRKDGVALINIDPHGGKIIMKTGVVLSHLTVEGRRSPIGLDVEIPRLGWQIETDKRDVVQQSYRVQVATADGTVWDSGEVQSDQSQWVAMGAKLSPNTIYRWRVKVKTNKGNSDWSEWSHWSTGLLSEQNWKGDWIGYDSLTSDVVMERHSRIAARHLRKSFALKKAVKRATAHICGLGYYILNINGQRIGDYLLAPAPTQYDKAVCYDTYDVSTPLALSFLGKRPVGPSGRGGGGEAYLAHHHAVFAKHLREPSCIDACDAWYLFTFQPIAEALLSVPMRESLAVVCYDNALGMDAFALCK